MRPDDARITLIGSAGRVRAVVDRCGAVLRSLTVAQRDLVEPCLGEVPDSSAAGAVLFPWPNRLRDGRWWDEGIERRLPIDEPGRNTANHGLVRDRVFAVGDRAPGAVTLSTRLDGAAGYPFALVLSLTYRLLGDGLLVRARVVNPGRRTAPFALGFHPYPRVGPVDTDDLVLELAAGLVLDLDDRLIPIGQHPVAGTTDDPAHLALAARHLHHCYGELAGAAAGMRCRLRAPDGQITEVRADPSFSWVQTYLCPDLPSTGGPRRAIAIEPMTAPPNALRSGRDLIRLAPGRSWTGSWSIHALSPPGALGLDGLDRHGGVGG